MSEHHHHLKELSVTYAAATKPYVRHDVPRTETVGQVKEHAMKAFHVVEQPNVAFTLYHGKKPLTELHEHIGRVAGDEERLHLKLVQEIKQG